MVHLKKLSISEKSDFFIYRIKVFYPHTEGYNEAIVPSNELLTKEEQINLGEEYKTFLEEQGYQTSTVEVSPLNPNDFHKLQD